MSCQRCEELLATIRQLRQELAASENLSKQRADELGAANGRIASLKMRYDTEERHAEGKEAT